MNNYDALEHDGDEDFSIQNRSDEKKVKKKVEEKKEQLKIDHIEKQQEEWLSIDNPFLWTNDV